MSRRTGTATARPGARRSPAAWLRRRLLGRLLAAVLPTLVGLGVCLGAALGQFVPVNYLYGAAAVAMAVAFGCLRLGDRWSVANIERGIDAEYRIGQVIEYAMVPRNCAVAHGVVGIAAAGDIDHLVATPGARWVVETKARAVPKDRFPVVLDRIARNVRAVEAWAPDVPVRGCLALLEPFSGRRDYEAGDGTAVVVHDERSLRDALRAEVRDGGSVGARLAQRIWKLGRVPAEPDGRRRP